MAEMKEPTRPNYLERSELAIESLPVPAGVVRRNCLPNRICTVALAERTILVVDDSNADADLIRLAFQKAGFNNTIQAVGDSAAALEFLKAEGEYADRARFPFPHLIIMDHQLPGDPLEVVRWVRGRHELKFVHVVVFSGSSNPNYEKEAYEAGANAYHIKPQDFGEFVAVIKRIGEFWLMGGAIG
jgi:two-component system response regulator